MTDKLKPCPFCGSYDIDYNDSKDFYKTSRVYCLNCSASVVFYDVKEAIKAWNARVEPEYNYSSYHDGASDMLKQLRRLKGEEQDE